MTGPSLRGLSHHRLSEGGSFWREWKTIHLSSCGSMDDFASRAITQRKIRLTIAQRAP